MKPRVLLQVRSSSNRLPHKCFLLIKNIPSIVYLYKRIKSKRYNTTILTSNDKSNEAKPKVKPTIFFFQKKINNYIPHIWNKLK